jgi:hypothetical protein
MEKTTIQLTKKTLERLKTFRRYERESYEEVLNSLMDESEAESVLTPQEIKEIEAGLEEVKRGAVVSFEEVVRKYNIKL